MSSYLDLRQELCKELSTKTKVPVSAHSGSFALEDVKKLALNNSDEILVALEGVGSGTARFQMYIKTRNASGYSADIRALGLILEIEKTLRAWKHELIAKKIYTTWEALPDNKLADMNVYIYRINANIAIYIEDYLEDVNGN